MKGTASEITVNFLGWEGGKIRVSVFGLVDKVRIINNNFLERVTL